MQVLAFLSGFSYLMVSLAVLLAAQRRSRFWIVYLSFEYFYIIGLGIYPIALAFHFGSIPDAYAYYTGVGSFSVLTFVHLLAYSFGALLGYFSFSQARQRYSQSLTKFSISLDIDSVRHFDVFVAIAYIAAVIFLSALGVERVLYGSALFRSGNAQEFYGFESYLFLTRFLYFGVYAVAFMPDLLCRKGGSPVRLLLLGILGVLGYFVLSARYMVFQCLLVPVLMYVVYQRKRGIGYIGMIAALFVLAFGFVFYGKELPSVVAASVFLGKPFEFNYSGDRVDFFEAFSHLLFSIDSGVRNYFAVGSMLSKDVLLAPFGVLPSSVLSAFGLGELSYQLADESGRFSCLNTIMITGNYGTCHLPPYVTGASAYLMPIAGGFAFGLFRFFIYAVVGSTWHRLSGSERYLAPAILVAICAEQLMLFIPNSGSFAIFLILFLAVSRILLRLLR